MCNIKLLFSFLFIFSIGINPSFGDIQQSQAHQVKHEHTLRPKGTPEFTCSKCGKIHDKANNSKKRNCSHCNGIPRHRSLPYLLSNIMPKYSDAKIIESLPLLAFAPDGIEQRYLKKYFKDIKIASLWGKYSSDSEVGVDARDLSRYKDNSFSGVYSMGTYDFIPEQEQAIKEAYRVIAPGGIFMILIIHYRLLDDNSPPVVSEIMKSSDNWSAYIPREVDITSIKVGKKWYVNAMNKAGFKGHLIDIYDEISGETVTWFIGEKPLGWAEWLKRKMNF